MKMILYIGNNFTAKSKYNSTMTTLSQLLIKEGFEVQLSSNKPNKLVRLMDMCWAVFKYRNNLDYLLIDTFSTTNFYYAFCISQLARFCKIKYIPILHGGNLPHRLDTSKKMSKMLFLNAYANVAPSEYLKTEFKKREYKSLLIPNVLTINEYQYKVRKLLKPALLWVRAFDKTYNPKMAINVLKEVKMAYPNALLCMVGPAKDETLAVTKEAAKKLNLENAIEFTGVLSKQEWHRKSEEFDIFINTANFDNTPVSVLEAMALGLPVITTNVGGIPYLINDNFDGILVEKNNHHQMAQAIIYLIRHPEKAIELSKNARIKVEYFDWNKVKNSWFDLLK